VRNWNSEDLGSCNIEWNVDRISGIQDNQSITTAVACIDDNDWTIFCRLLKVREQWRQEEAGKVRQHADAGDDIIPLHGQLPDFLGLDATRHT